jgi:signal transduction histidine kinase
MRKPWQIWLLFAFCLALVLPGMMWLSVKVLELDRAEAESQRSAERQERVAAALWRMDWMLTPLIAQEAARPSFQYRSFLSPANVAGGKTSLPSTPSPLLLAPPDYVLLYFEVDSEQNWSSPQLPERESFQAATSAGLAASSVAQNRQRLIELQKAVSYDELLPILPDTMLPSVDLASISPDVNRGWLDASLYASNSARRQDSLPTQSQQELDLQQREDSFDSPLAAQVPAQQSGAGQQGQIQMAQQPSLRRQEDEFARRNRGVQNMARSQRVQQLSNTAFISPMPAVQEGVSRPVWIGSKLLLARRVVQGTNVRLQGCWLDWPQIERTLQAEVADLLPSVHLAPVRADANAQPGRLLATLPVQLTKIVWSSDEVEMEKPLSAVRVSLIIAWCCSLLATIAVAVVLRGVISLSERRAAFVSAVTHELRTPLTTFRMYAEMLSEGMVVDKEQQQTYLDTLRVEADRLSHLVDNVLQYARLERGAQVKRRELVELGELRRQCEDRLAERVAQAEMKLVSELADADAKCIVNTDPAAVEQILFNLVDNACKYAGSASEKSISVTWTVDRRQARIRVRDHGPGISAEQARKLFKPFSKSDQEAAQTAPGIGLGLALCHRLAADLGGQLIHVPDEDGGAVFELVLPLKS